MSPSSNDFDLRSRFATAVIWGFLLLVAGVRAGSAQQPAKTGAPASQAAAASAAKPAVPVSAPVAESAAETQNGEAANPAKPGTDGIRVHGHWVLEVKRADGTIRDRREFDNSLVTTYTPGSNGGAGTTSGAAFLAALLAQSIAPSQPAIGFIQLARNAVITLLSSSDPSTWCQTTLATAGINCYAFTTSGSLWNENYQLSGNGGLASVQLGLILGGTYTPSASLVLSGNYTVPAGLTSISAVQTLYGGCAGNITPGQLSGAIGYGYANTAPNTCYTVNNILNPYLNNQVQQIGALTSTQITPMGVTQGEIVAVTVTISFS